jgi:hypothetical protein
MQQKSEVRLRFIRFVCWASAMCAASVIFDFYDPMKAKYVPMVFIALIGPAILLPLKSKKNTIA